MLFNPFKKATGGKKKNSLESVLADLVKKEPDTANCSLLKTRDGEETDEDLGQVLILQHADKTLIQNKAFYISTPDGIKAEDKSLLSGKDEILHLWFLVNRIPHTVDCRVMGRIWFPDDIIGDLDQIHESRWAYALKPIGVIRKTDKRQFLRYSHKPERGGCVSIPRFSLISTSRRRTSPSLKPGAFLPT